METFHDDSKFGGKSISSPIKSIEVITWNKGYLFMVFLG